MKKQLFSRVKSLPVIGNGFEVFNAGVLTYPNRKQPLYGNYFWDTNPRTDLYFVLDPDGIQHILEKNPQNYKKSEAYDVLKILLGDGLFTAEWDIWKKHRKVIQPSFRHAQIQSLFSVISDATEHFLESFPTGKSVSLETVFSKLTLSVATQSFFGIDLAKEAPFIPESIQYLNQFASKKLEEIIPIPEWIPLPSHFKAKREVNKLRGFVQDLLDSRRGEEGHYDLMSMLLGSTSLSDTEITDEMLTFLVAGFETTTYALSYTLFLILTHPDVLHAIKDEIKIVYKGDKPSLDTIKKCPYLTAVIKESLRLYPPAWVLGRIAIEDDEINGYHVPKDKNILLPIYSVQRLESLWDDAETFKPERFLGDNTYHKYQYIPFGGGPRICIGQHFAMLEISYILIRVFQEFDMTLQTDSFKVKPLISLHPKTPIMCEFRRL